MLLRYYLLAETHYCILYKYRTKLMSSLREGKGVFSNYSQHLKERNINVKYDLLRFCKKHTNIVQNLI